MCTLFFKLPYNLALRSRNLFSRTNREEVDGVHSKTLAAGDLAALNDATTARAAAQADLASATSQWADTVTDLRSRYTLAAIGAAAGGLTPQRIHQVARTAA